MGRSLWVFPLSPLRCTTRCARQTGALPNAGAQSPVHGKGVFSLSGRKRRRLRRKGTCRGHRTESRSTRPGTQPGSSSVGTAPPSLSELADWESPDWPFQLPAPAAHPCCCPIATVVPQCSSSAQSLPPPSRSSSGLIYQAAPLGFPCLLCPQLAPLQRRRGSTCWLGCWFSIAIVRPASSHTAHFPHLT